MSEERIIAEIITLIKYKNKEYEVRDLINYLCNEIEKRDNIIKEVRDLVNKEEFTMKQKYEMREELLEILKGSDKE